MTPGLCAARMVGVMNISRAMVAVALVLSLVACATEAPPEVADPAPIATEETTPTPEPTKPAIAELVVSSNGLGPLVVGAEPPVVDPARDILIFDEDRCQADVDEGAIDEPGKWIANYEPALSDKFERKPFSANVVDDTVRIISIEDPDIRTEDGLGLGSTKAEVLAQYPDAEYVKVFNSDLLIVEGERGSLVFEVITYNDTTDFFGPDGAQIDDVVFLRVYAAGTKISAWMSTDTSIAYCQTA